MKKRRSNLLKYLWLSAGLLISFYLILPPPQLPPPDLPLSLKSTEPGDTVQIPNVAAYFTDSKRREIVDFFTKQFARSRWHNLPLPTYRLNHPPEYAKKVIRDTTRSYYLEEIVHPMRESLFVNGFEWEQDPFTKPEARAKNKIFVAGRIWRAKITLRWFTSNPFVRVLIFWLGWGFLFISLIEIQKEAEVIKKIIKTQRTPK